MAKTPFTNKWIIENGIPIVESYDGNLTLRALHYRLVALGMINDTAHYKKVVSAISVFTLLFFALAVYFSSITINAFL